jgi:hypothetical protein
MMYDVCVFVCFVVSGVAPARIQQICQKGDVSCPAFEFIYIYFSFTLSRFSF